MDRNEAIKVIKDNLTEIRPQLSEAIQILIPELKESEDEKIRKMLIEQMERWHECALANNVVQDIKDSADAITYLEKQGEHANFRNKIQIGDEVTRNEDGILVNLSQFDRVVKERVKQGEQNSAWGEEDMGMMVLVAKILDNHKSDTDFVLYNTPYENVVSWLKSLKNRAQPQSKQEWSWSKEDEAHVKSLCKRLKGLCRREFVTTRFAINEDEEWLKSIKEKMKGE